MDDLFRGRRKCVYSERQSSAPRVVDLRAPAALRQKDSRGGFRCCENPFYEFIGPRSKRLILLPSIGFRNTISTIAPDFEPCGLNP
jgi:hypothetical protein